jgi:hypothetical protein
MSANSMKYQWWIDAISKIYKQTYQYVIILNATCIKSDLLSKQNLFKMSLKYTYVNIEHYVTSSRLLQIFNKH